MPLHEFVSLIAAAEAAGQTNYRALAERIGYDVLERRILKQANLWAKEAHQGQGFFAIERFVPVDDLIHLGLKLLGVAALGRRNYLDVQITHNELLFTHLPAAFEGFRLMQLTDLHCDLDPEIVDVVIDRLKGLSCDAVALTGDYHNKIAENYDASLDLMGRLLSQLPEPRFGILGNHDFIEKATYLESAGLPMLLNESAFIEREGERLWFCGVDDPHYFRTDDLKKARAGIPADAAVVLLSHSPEPYQEADAMGFEAMICGHTHGGQICLPGGIPVVQNARVPRSLLSGRWQQGGLTGYTSRGTGGCGVPARFFCPPEITIHTLRRRLK